MSEEYLHSELTSKIIKSFYTVYNTLGYGFLEKVYENSLKIELQLSGLNVEAQKKIDVYYADLIVNDAVILEIKAAEGLCEEHEFQLINYLKATDLEVGLLLNFGKKPEFKRKVYTNNYKNNEHR